MPISVKKIRGKEVITIVGNGENCTCHDCPVLYGGECYTTEENNKTKDINMEKENKPNPGSAEAERAGCVCPVMDNHYGRGVPGKDGPRFWYSGDCPVHGDNLKFK